jgi:hypothetical protein
MGRRRRRKNINKRSSASCKKQKLFIFLARTEKGSESEIEEGEENYGLIFQF